MANYTVKFDFRGLWILAFIFTALFLILKLCHQIAWGWFWVFSPIVGVIALYCLILIAFIIVLIVNKLAEKLL